MHAVIAHSVRLLLSDLHDSGELMQQLMEKSPVTFEYTVLISWKVYNWSISMYGRCPWNFFFRVVINTPMQKKSLNLKVKSELVKLSRDYQHGSEDEFWRWGEAENERFSCWKCHQSVKPFSLGLHDDAFSVKTFHSNKIKAPSFCVQPLIGTHFKTDL